MLGGSTIIRSLFNVVKAIRHTNSEVNFVFVSKRIKKYPIVRCKKKTPKLFFYPIRIEEGYINPVRAVSQD